MGKRMLEEYSSESQLLRLSFTDLEYKPVWQLDRSAFTFDASSQIDEAPAPRGLVVEIDASHIGYINLNWKFYVPRDAKKAAATFIQPYPKPVLRHHGGGGGLFSGSSIFEDPIGRVTDSSFVKLISGKLTDTPLSDNTPQGVNRITVAIGDLDAAEKILDGRYSTVSVRAVPASVTCSVCQQEWIAPQHKKRSKKGEKEEEVGPCEHRPGQYYDGKICYLNYGGYVYGEVSFVNFPADLYAKATGWENPDSDQSTLEFMPRTRIHIVSGAEPVDQRRLIIPAATLQPQAYALAMDMVAAAGLTAEGSASNASKTTGDDSMKDDVKSLEDQLKETNTSLEGVTQERDQLQKELDKSREDTKALQERVESNDKSLEASATTQRSIVTSSLTFLRRLNGAYGQSEDEIKTAIVEAVERLKDLNLDALVAMFEEELSTANHRLGELISDNTDDESHPDAVAESVGDTDGQDGTDGHPQQDDPTQTTLKSGEETTPIKDFLAGVGIESK